MWNKYLNVCNKRYKLNNAYIILNLEQELRTYYKHLYK